MQSRQPFFRQRQPSTAVIASSILLTVTGACGVAVDDRPAHTRARTDTEEPIVFDNACVDGTRVTIAAVGDLLLHEALQRQAAWNAEQNATEQKATEQKATEQEKAEHDTADARGAAGFASLLQHVAPQLRGADLTFANMEGPLARDSVSWQCEPVAVDADALFDGVAYTGYPQFNAHPSFARAIAAAGVDIVQLANNHALDRRGCALDRTIGALSSAGVASVGAISSSEAASGISPERAYVVREVEGVRIAFVAYTYSTNCIADDRGEDRTWNTDDDRPRVAYIDRQCVMPPSLNCNSPVWPQSDPAWGCPARPADEPAHPAVFETIRQARGDSDLVIVGMHWGNEYQTIQTQAQTGLAHRLLDAGADVILGGHPHVLQPMERYLTKDPVTLEPRETFVIYSLGNFLSAQQTDVHRRTGVILYLGITKPEGRRAVLSGVRFLPTAVVAGFQQPSQWSPEDAWQVKPVAPGHPSYLEATGTLGGGALTADEPAITNPGCDR